MAATQLFDISLDSAKPRVATLGSLRPGDEGIIASLASTSEPGVRMRLLSLGFAPGTRIKVVRKAPLADPTEYELRGGRISLRRSEADLVTISL